MKTLDFILITVYITISIVIGVLLLWTPSEAPEVIEVRVDNVLYGRYALPLETPVALNLDQTGHNVLILDGYTAYMEEADCPDQLCVQQGVIDTTGGLLVCLPNKVTVEIKGGQNNAVDIISY